MRMHAPAVEASGRFYICQWLRIVLPAFSAPVHVGMWQCWCTSVPWLLRLMDPMRV